MLILLSLGCLFARQEQCDQATAQTLHDWEEVAGYYTRMGALKEQRVAEAQAQLDAATAQREQAERRRRSVSSKRSTGLVDLRDGTERVDASVSKELAPLQARARRAREEGADAEAEAALELLEVQTEHQTLSTNAALAEAVVQALRSGPLSEALTLANSTAPKLSDTELTGIALQSQALAQKACEGL